MSAGIFEMFFFSDDSEFLRIIKYLFKKGNLKYKKFVPYSKVDFVAVQDGLIAPPTKSYYKVPHKDSYVYSTLKIYRTKVIVKDEEDFRNLFVDLINLTKDLNTSLSLGNIFFCAASSNLFENGDEYSSEHRYYYDNCGFLEKNTDVSYRHFQYLDDMGRQYCGKISQLLFFAPYVYHGPKKYSKIDCNLLRRIAPKSTFFSSVYNLCWITEAQKDEFLKNAKVKSLRELSELSLEHEGFEIRENYGKIVNYNDYKK